MLRRKKSLGNFSGKFSCPMLPPNIQGLRMRQLRYAFVQRMNRPSSPSLNRKGKSKELLREDKRENATDLADANGSPKLHVSICGEAGRKN